MSNASKSPAPTGQPKITTLTLDVNGTEVPFRCFDNQLGKTVTREILAGEIYRWPEGLSPPRTIVDIGANVGAAALYFALNFPEAQILCFEPSPICLPLLEHNLRNYPNISIAGYGLFDRDTKQKLYRSGYDPVTSSLGQSAYNADASDEVELRDAAKAMFENEISMIDCLKIDTEGSEVPILESLAPFLETTSVLFVEYHSEGDRRRIDLLMAQHHMLVGGRVQGPHRGEFTYARRASYSDKKKRDRLQVELPRRKGSPVGAGKMTATSG